MRRRTKPRVVWLPPTNRNSLDVATKLSGIQRVFLDVPNDSSTAGNSSAGEIPLVIDGEALDPLGTDITLGDLNNSSYRLRRIVGKLFAFRQVRGSTDEPIEVIFTAGIMVRKADDVTGDSLALQSGSSENLAPQQIRNFADPWVWRRSWMLGDPTALLAGSSVRLGDELCIANYGPRGPCSGISDGPHIDQKTARVIGPEERLYLSFQCSVTDPATTNSGPGAIGSIEILTDLRVLGTMRTGIGNRGNSTR